MIIEKLKKTPGMVLLWHITRAPQAPTIFWGIYLALTNRLDELRELAFADLGDLQERSLAHLQT